MKKSFQKTLLILIGFCVLVSMFNFFVPIDASARLGDGCYGKVVDDPHDPEGWDCECGDFVDCWKRL